MRTILAILLTMSSTTGCTQDKPVATLKYLEIQKVSEFYEIKFASDIDLDTIFNPELGEKIVSQRLVCALEGDQDFSVNHSMQRYLRGDVNIASTTSRTQSDKFVYLSKANFYESFDKDTSRKYIADAPLRKILQAQSAIPCKIVMTVYAKRPYYSSTMLVPTQDILKYLPPAD